MFAADEQIFKTLSQLQIWDLEKSFKKITEDKRYGVEMRTIEILQKLENKKNKPEDLVHDVLENSELIPVILDGITSKKARVRFGAAKLLRIISQEQPEMLYPHFKHFMALLGCENNIIKWNAMDVLANLAVVDIDNRFDEIFDEYYGLITDDVMITAGHVIDNSGKIAQAKPHLQSKITKNLLMVEKTHRNQECKNILMGKAILSFGEYFNDDNVENKNEIIAFVKRQLTNSRNATKKKAEKFLKQNRL